ncbi:DNA polymerase-3 subunit epsilon [Arthrobacter sp. B2I5]|nr:DNA polymerase-3 subunit epsilon [Arthrobacter sp. B2I5]
MDTARSFITGKFTPQGYLTSLCLPGWDVDGGKVGAVGLDFTAIDFETANGFRGSPCSVGLTKVRGGRIVAEASWLMRPPAGYDHFDYHNVRIHGITPADVAGTPRFGELFPEIGAFIGDDVLAAHNAAFDLGVIRSALEVSGLPGPAYDYVCTVMLSRRCYSLVSNSLPFAAEEAGVPLVNHHDAAEDARACAGILIDIAARNGANSIAELFLSLGLAMPHQQAFDPASGELSKASLAAMAAASGNGAALVQRFQSGWPEEGPNPEPDLDAEPGHPLYAQTVVFTGQLSIDRPEAKLRSARCGARTESRVTGRTTVLVVGDGFVASDLRSGRLTGKARRVLELHERGQAIEVLSEGEFLQMVGGGDVPQAAHAHAGQVRDGAAAISA